MSTPTSIPTITPYEPPGHGDLPSARVAWQPDPRRAALLIHDMQAYFLRFLPVGRPPTTNLLRNARRLREAAAAHAIPVFYTAQPGGMTPSQRGLLRDLWGPGMGTDDASRRIVPEVAPRPGDTVLTKWRYSAFHRSDLRQRLAEAGRDQLIVCGVYAHVGILATAIDAFSCDVQPFLVADAVADFSREDHELALDYAARRCARVLPTNDVLAALATSVEGAA